MKSRTTLLLIAILIAGAVIRLLLITTSLEYDEMWTLRNYAVKPVGVIFSNLATPNNHPLNSLCVKAMLPFFRSCYYSIRLVPFLCGLLSLYLTWLLGKMLFRSRMIGLCAAAAVAFNPWTIEYSVLARGYSLQIFLILLFMVSMLKARKTPQWYFISTAAGGLSVLTLAPSVLFLIPVCGLELLYSFHLKNRKQIISGLISYIVLGGFVLTWFLIHRADFQHGQMFGNNVRSFKLFFDFIISTFMELTGFPAVLVLLGAGALCVLDWRRRTFVGLFAVLFFPLLFALVFKAGPPRVYLPLIPFIAIADAAVLVYLSPRKFVKWSALLCMLLLTGVCWLTHAPVNKVNWRDIALKIHKTPDYTYFVIPACEALPAFSNGQDYAGDFSKKLFFFGSDPQKSSLIAVDRAGLNGVDIQGNEVMIPIPNKPVVGKLERFTTFRWRVKPLTQSALAQSGVVFLRFAEVKTGDMKYLYQYLSQIKGVRKVVILNKWYSLLMKRKDNGTHIFLYAVQLDLNKTSAGAFFTQVCRIRTLTGVFTAGSFYDRNQTGDKK